MKLVCSLLVRSVEELGDFDFEIRYIPNPRNTAADALSRIAAPLASTVLAQMDCCFDGFAVPGGGNSMFVSLLRCLRQNSKEISIPGNEKEIREILVDYLLNNNSKYNIQLDRKSRKRLKLTRLTNQLPSIDVLLAANRIFRVRIFVYFWTQ